MPTKNEYDPTISQPTYQAYQPPEPAPPPPPVPQSQPFQFAGLPISKAGAAAGLLDNIFKGYMNGKAAAAQKVAGQFKAKSDGLVASHKNDEQKLNELIKAGVDPNSDDYKTAKLAEQTSYGAMLDWQEKMVNGPDGGSKPKKSSKKGAQSQQPTDQPQTPQQQIEKLKQIMQTGNPQEKASALLQIRKLVGSPMSSMTKWYESPAGQAQREQYNQAYAVVNPPKPSESTGKVEWLAGEDGKKKPFELQDGRYVPVEVPEGFQPPTKPPTASELKRKDYDDALKKGYKGSYEEWIAEESTRGHRSGGGGSESGGGAPMFSNTPEGKHSLQVYRDLSKRYTNLSQGDLKDLADVAAKSPKDAEDSAARASSYLSSDEKAMEYESAVLEHAMSVVRSNSKDAVNQDGDQVDIDKALSNIVGHNGKYLQYGSPRYAPKKLFGNAGQGQVKDMENALQDAIEETMKSKQFALPSTLADEIQQGRFHPFIGDSSAPEPVNVREKRSTTTPGSPQAGAASAPAASSPSATGGKKQSKGEVWKSDFIKENKGATDAHWDTMKKQLKEQGYEPIDK